MILSVLPLSHPDAARLFSVKIGSQS